MSRLNLDFFLVVPNPLLNGLDVGSPPLSSQVPIPAPEHVLHFRIGCCLQSFVDLRNHFWPFHGFVLLKNIFVHILHTFYFCDTILLHGKQPGRLPVTVRHLLCLHTSWWIVSFCPCSREPPPLPCFLIWPGSVCRQTYRHRVLLGLITAYHISTEKGMSIHVDLRTK